MWKCLNVEILEFGKSFDLLTIDGYCEQGDIYKDDDKDHYIHYWWILCSRGQFDKDKDKVNMNCFSCEYCVQEDKNNDYDKDNDRVCSLLDTVLKRIITKTKTKFIKT